MSKEEYQERKADKFEGCSYCLSEENHYCQDCGAEISKKEIIFWFIIIVVFFTILIFFEINFFN